MSSDDAIDKHGADVATDARGPEPSLGAFAEVISYIERRHHTFLHHELPRLASLMERAVSASGESYSSGLAAVRRMYAALKPNLEAHMRTEEQVLFPCIRQVEASACRKGENTLFHRRALRDVLEQIRQDHEEVLGSFQRIRDVTSDFRLPDDSPEDLQALYGGLQALEEDLREHIRLEDRLGEHIEQMSSTSAELMRMESDLCAAREVQRNLLPDRLPDAIKAKNLAFCVSASPATEVGGDFHEFFSKDDGTLVLALGDVAGKGVTAALLMTMTWTLLLQFAREEASPSAVLRRMNQALFEATEPAKYVTLFLAFYNTEKRSLVYANAGHCPAIVARPSGSTGVLDSTVTVLGLFDEYGATDAEIRLAPGEKLVAYSDGITEATDGDGEMFGFSRLREQVAAGAARPPQELVGSIIDSVRVHQADGEDADDTTLWVMEVR